MSADFYQRYPEVKKLFCENQDTRHKEKHEKEKGLQLLDVKALKENRIQSSVICELCNDGTQSVLYFQNAYEEYKKEYVKSKDILKFNFEGFIPLLKKSFNRIKEQLQHISTIFEDGINKLEQTLELIKQQQFEEDQIFKIQTLTDMQQFAKKYYNIFKAKNSNSQEHFQTFINNNFSQRQTQINELYSEIFSTCFNKLKCLQSEFKLSEDRFKQLQMDTLLKKCLSQFQEADIDSNSKITFDNTEQNVYISKDSQIDHYVWEKDADGNGQKFKKKRSYPLEQNSSQPKCLIFQDSWFTYSNENLIFFGTLNSDNLIIDQKLDWSKEMISPINQIEFDPLRKSCFIFDEKYFSLWKFQQNKWKKVVQIEISKYRAVFNSDYSLLLIQTKDSNVIDVFQVLDERIEKTMSIKLTNLQINVDFFIDFYEAKLLIFQSQILQIQDIQIAGNVTQVLVKINLFQDGQVHYSEKAKIFVLINLDLQTIFLYKLVTLQNSKQFMNLIQFSQIPFQYEIETLKISKNGKFIAFTDAKNQLKIYHIKLLPRYDIQPTLMPQFSFYE